MTFGARRFRVRAPRLLPVTIALLAVVLVWKSTVLVRSAIIPGQPSALVAAAWAGGSEAPATAGNAALKPTDLARPPKPERGPEIGIEPPRPDASLPPAQVTDGERAVLLELRERRKELEAREATLSARESLVAAAETKLSSRVEELQSLQKKLESLDASHRQQEDVAWQGLVKVYETMKPRDAATIFNELGMHVLLSVIDRMKEAKAAAILAAMSPDKARDVTMQLAMSRASPSTAARAGDKPALNAEPAKGPGSGT